MEKLAGLIRRVRRRLPPSRRVHGRPLSLPSIRSQALVAFQTGVGKEGIMSLRYAATRGPAADELTHLSIIQRGANLWRRECNKSASLE